MFASCEQYFWILL